MAIHIWHHFDADGFCAASVVRGFLNITNDFLKEHNKYNPLMQVLNHPYPMKWNNVSDGDVIFILDYAFTREDDVAEIISRMDKVRFIWIDHHISSEKLIKEHPELQKLVETGLIYTDEPKLSGCFLTFLYMLWNYSEKRDTPISSLSKDQIADLKVSIESIPDFVRIVSDYDTFTHEYSISSSFVKALGFVGLRNAFYSDSMFFTLGDKEYVSFDIALEVGLMTRSGALANDPEWVDNTYDSFVSSRSSVTMVTKVSTESSLITKKLADKGEQISDIMRVYDAKDVKSKAFESIIRIPNDEGNATYEEFKILVLNKAGNSQMFGQAYYDYDGVVSMTFNGEQFVYSVFSHNDNGLNCELVGAYFKKVFGITGGGHKQAAGFSSLSPVFMKDMISILDNDAFRLIRKDGTGIVTEVRFAEVDGFITLDQYPAGTK